MTKYIEDDLEFDFSWADSSFNYDDDTKLSGNEMKRVDFIAEKNGKCFLIEIKDPDHPKGERNLKDNKQKLLSGKLVPDLAIKFRDSLWFRALSYKAQKELHYVVLFSMKSIEPALLLSRSDALYKAIPITHPEWVMNMANSCIILNIEQYKKQFGEDSVRRISDGNL